MPRPYRRHAIAVLAASVAVVALASGCGGPGHTRDVAGDRRPRPANTTTTTTSSNAVPEPPAVPDRETAKGPRPRMIAKASARALALDGTHVYYGDSEDDGIYSIAKSGGAPLRIARHAPVAGAIAVENGSITWIASPGDAVLRSPLTGGVQPTTLRDRGIFSDVAAVGEDVFIAEAIASGGALIRVTGATASRIAAFEGAPRAVMADKTHAFVLTSSKILRAPHQRGELETIATGTRFSNADIDDAFVYAAAEVDKSRAVVRFPKAGGPMMIVVRDVRDAPIDVDGGELFYFDAVRPQLRAVPVGGGASRVVAEDEGFLTVAAMEADASNVYVAEGARETGVIVAVGRTP